MALFWALFIINVHDRASGILNSPTDIRIRRIHNSCNERVMQKKLTAFAIIYILETITILLPAFVVYENRTRTRQGKL